MYIPKYLVYRQGILRNIEIEYDENYLKSRIQPHDFHCKFSVISVTRLKRKIIENDFVKYDPTKSVLVNFRSQTLPKYVVLNKVITHVETYIML